MNNLGFRIIFALFLLACMLAAQGAVLPTPEKMAISMERLLESIKSK